MAPACGDVAASEGGSAPGGILYSDAHSVPYVTVVVYPEVKLCVRVNSGKVHSRVCHTVLAGEPDSRRGVVEVVSGECLVPAR